MLSREDPFYSPKKSIERGKHHTADLTKGIKFWAASKPYAIVREADPDTGGQVEKVRITKPFPDDLESIALDAAANLRNALDQAIYSIVRRDSQFPFGKTLLDFENTVKGRCGHVPKDIIDLIRGFQPYIGGDSTLWALSKFANTTKHGIIVPMCANVGTMTTGTIFVEKAASDKPFHFSVPQWDFAKNEMVICRFGGNTGIRYDNSNFRASLFIAVHGIPVIESKPIEGVLEYLIRKVGEIVADIEAKAISLKLI